MMTMLAPDTSAKAPKDDALAMKLGEYTLILQEDENQPRWRHNADKEMDYADGNQLDSELLNRQKELGIPPAIEDLTGPALLSLQGYEAKTRTDWRVTADGGTGGQDIADAINYKLNQAERASKADLACSGAFRTQAAVGIGWVEVSRNSDPLKFPYRCSSVHRNEISWDFQAKEADLSDARWLRRKRWMRPERIALAFPKQKALIDGCGREGANWWANNFSSLIDEGGMGTGLQNAWNAGTNWTIEEARWYDPNAKDLCLSEFWYRRWVNVPVLTTPDGRVVEYDEGNMAHVMGVSTGATQVTNAIAARMRRAFWLGPHCLHDGPSPYTHTDFPYVPFFGFREDRTNVPYGYVRGMVYQQDSLNSGQSKLRWGMSVARSERTKGAVDMTDAQFRKMMARPDADIVLNAEAMSQPGARFEVKRDYQLTGQHFEMLQSARASIERVSGMTSGFMGKQGTATSGLQEQTQVEQSNQSLAHLMDNFRAARSEVGERLIAMIIEDMGKEHHTIIIEGDAVKEDRSVEINKPEVDEMGIQYLSNDLQRTRLKVALEDVPSSTSYRAQQLNSFSEAVKSLPAEYQAAVLPFMVSLMNVPFKKEVVEAIKQVSQQETPEAIQQRIEQGIKDGVQKAGLDIKARELDLKYSPDKLRAEIAKIVSETVKIGVESAYASMEAGQVIATMPQVAPIADVVMQGAGYQSPTPGGVDPNFPQPAAPVAGVPAPDVRQNTSPQLPPVPQGPGSPMQGIETQRADGVQPSP